MLLKRLEAYGFKSFADKLEVEFDEGITAIVGPNGSGKSNITDAIRWVLGEQNIRNLRGTKSEDVIFNGSSSRRALGMAEVSLTFDNSDASLPLDYQEVMITRRIYRTGESEFYINKTKCRLKDIFNLFADTGLGKNSISVISQNKVDEVLNTKPEDRRYFFEECAGITKYRDRKKESLRKLESTGQNLIRLQDIFGELEKQLKPLEVSAAKTARFNEINSTYESCKITNLLNQYEGLSKFEQEELETIENYKQKQLELEVTVNVSEADKLKKQQEISGYEKELKSLEGKLSNYDEEAQRCLNRSTMLEERLKQTIQAQGRLKQQEEEILANLKIVTTELSESERKVELSGKTADALVGQLKEIQQKQGNIEAQIIEEEKGLKRQQEYEVEQRGLIQMEQQVLLKLQRNLSDIDASIGVEQQNHQYIIKEKIEKNSQKEIVESNISSLEEEKNKVNKELTFEKHKLIKFTEECNALDHSLQEINQYIRGIEEKTKLYQGMQEAYEGFGKATRKILKAKEDWSKGVCGAVAELIQVDEQFVTAIDVALGSAMQNIVVRDTETAKLAIKYLQKNRLGRVTFMPLTTIQGHASKRENIEPGKYGFIAYADEVVSIDNEYRLITQSLLGRIIVVDCIDNALLLAKMYKYRLRIVTLNGELLHPGGALSGGSSNTKETGFLHRAGELLELKENLSENRKLQKKYKSELEVKKEKKNILASHHGELQNKLQHIELQVAQLIYEKKQIEEWFKQQDLRIEGINNHIAALNTKKIAVEEEIEIQNIKLRELEDQLNQRQDDYSEVEEKLQFLRNELKLILTKLGQKQISVTEAQQEVLRFNEKVKMYKEQIERYKKNLEEFANERINLETIIVDSKKESRILEETNLNIRESTKTITKERNKVYQRLIGLREDLEEMAKERSKISGQVSELKDKMHKCELVLTKYKAEIKQLLDDLQKNYQLTPEMALQRKVSIDDEELKHLVKKLEKELKDLGPINPNAIEEYNALNERYKFMEQQIQDLKNAKEDLEELIHQIDKTMANQFKIAFDKIQISFNDIFKKLFGGGKGELILTTPDDLLNTGIEIKVEPPEKKPLSMVLLSGGERTLTVIALLFAFFSYNPAPFSVLDEIDAPLDEANVKRFANFLNNYAKNTQFILVTHRKGTMEAANTLYGVTIEDAGISKLISVKLDDYVERK